jgi:hypothetical protein
MLARRVLKLSHPEKTGEGRGILHRIGLFPSASILPLAAFCFSNLQVTAVASAPARAATDAQQALSSRLKSSGWSESAADAVVHLNEDRYFFLSESAPSVLELEIRGYEKLRPNGRTDLFLQKHPEMAGVLLLAKDTAAVVEGILGCDQEHDRQRIINSFTKYTDSDDITRWAQAVARHRRCIVGLLRRCPSWPVDALFVLGDSKTEASEEYARWLDDLFEPAALSSNDEDTVSLVEFVLAAGPEIRRRIESNIVFRKSFRGSIWPAFTRCVRRSGQDRVRIPWEFFATTPHLWDLLQRSDGEALFQRAGLLAADLLFGSEGVSPELREKVAQMLLCGKQDLLERVFEKPWSNHPNFRSLMLDRHMSDERILTAFSKLLSESEPEATLVRWSGLSNSALVEDIGPEPEGVRTYIPGFNIYYAGKKLAQGRKLSWFDALAVAGDAATFFTLGTGKLFTESGKQLGSVAVKQKLRQEAAKDLAALTAREIAEQAAEKEMGSLVVNHALRSLPVNIKDRLLQVAVIDLTEFVKGGFEISKHAGLGRESFKRITSLEARFFMRSDAKVFVSLPAVVAGKYPAARFLSATAQNAGWDEALKTQVARDVLSAAIRVAKDDVPRLNQHLACWFAGLATGAFGP